MRYDRGEARDRAPARTAPTHRESHEPAYQGRTRIDGPRRSQGRRGRALCQRHGARSVPRPARARPRRTGPVLRPTHRGRHAPEPICAGHRLPATGRSSGEPTVHTQDHVPAALHRRAMHGNARVERSGTAPHALPHAPRRAQALDRQAHHAARAGDRGGRARSARRTVHRARLQPQRRADGAAKGRTARAAVRGAPQRAPAGAKARASTRDRTRAHRGAPAGPTGPTGKNDATGAIGEDNDDKQHPAPAVRMRNQASGHRGPRQGHVPALPQERRGRGARARSGPLRVLA